LCIDPALGRGVSKPAFALFRDGTEQQSGVFRVRLDSTQECLRQLFWTVRDFVEEHLDEPFVLVIEELRGSMVHCHLHWAAGTIVAAACPTMVVELPICFWKAQAKTDPKYRKGDIADAIQFGKTIMALVAEQGTLAPRVRRKRAAKRRRGRR
jgi:hypothetical protein